MFENKIIGSVWKFSDNISTDLMMPGFAAMNDPNMPLAEAARYCMYSNRPEWSAQVKESDIIISGKNFGCGSSRPAARMLQALGIRLVIAESVSRIFFRNSINLGLPVIECRGISEAFEEGETIEADISTGIIRSLATGRELYCEPLPDGSPPMEIIRAGGLISMLKKQKNEL